MSDSSSSLTFEASSLLALLLNLSKVAGSHFRPNISSNAENLVALLILVLAANAASCNFVGQVPSEFNRKRNTFNNTFKISNISSGFEVLEQ